MKFAVTVDGTNKDAIPKSTDKGTNNNYYRVKATCDDGITAEWDYNAWNLKVEDIQKGTKCKLAFTSDLTTAERDELLKKGVSERRNTYRGEDITKYIEGTQINGRNLYKQISDCTFDDIYVGDYIVDKKTNKKDINNQTIRYLVADINNYLYSGNKDNELKQCHITMIPAAPLTNAKMNSTATTVNGYAGSEMVKTTLPSILSTYITPVFGNNVITYSTILSNGVDTTLPNRHGQVKGASNSFTWENRQLDLMSETCVFGNVVFSSSGFDIGLDTKQYAIFQLKPEFINSYLNSERFSFWLKDVVGLDRFAASSNLGFSSNGSTSTFEQGVRPRFLIR